MPDATSPTPNSATLPPGFAAVPLTGGQEASPLRLCVVVRKSADPVAGHVVVVRETVEARVLLGCVTDAAARVHRWVELWVQAPESLARTPAAHRQFLTNAVLDERWRQQCAAYDLLDRPGLLRTGWESQNPPPLAIDLDDLAPASLPAEGEGGPWAVCKDDALLSARGLPGYAGSLARYLYRPGASEGSPLVAVCEDCPGNESTRTLAQVIGGRKLLPIDPAGGLLMVRPHYPTTYEELSDLLSGAPAEGGDANAAILPVSGGIRAGGSDPARADDGRFFSARRGRAGLVIETLHLKLRLIAGALGSVRALVAHTRRPLLNLSASSFAVSVADPAPGLPHLWTTRVHLVDPGDAVALRVPGTEAQYFVRARSGASVYRAATVDEPTAGYGSLRVREVRDDARGAVLVGTFTAQERMGASPSDLIWLRLNLGAGPVDVYAHLEPDRAAGAKPLAVGEWRIRTLPHALPDAVVKALRAPQGYSFGKVYYELIPLLSTPCDVYSLGVLAVRTLLASPKNPLSFAWDEAMSLAAQVAREHALDVSVTQRVARIFDAEPRWANALGPQQLLAEGVSTDEALAVVPRELWFETLAAVVRMFPGVGPDSFCRDFGSAPPQAIHQAFDAPLEAFNLLLTKTRSLLLSDWGLNREVTRLLKRQISSLPGGGT